MKINENVKFGKGKKKQNVWVDILGKVTQYVGNELIGSNFSNCEIKIKFSKMQSGQYGVSNFKIGENTHKDNKFNFEISDDVSFNMMVLAICHEMIHVSQVYRGDLEFLSDTVAKWKNKEIQISKNNTSGNKNLEIDVYKNFPWEIEAHRNEEKLMLLVSKEFKDYRIKNYEFLGNLFE